MENLPIGGRLVDPAAPLGSGVVRSSGDADPLAALVDLPGVADAAAEATLAVDRLLAHRVLRRDSASVSTESALRGARASAALAGEEVALSVIRVGGGGPVVRGALRVGAELGTLSGTWTRAPGQVLARLHVLAARELLPAERLGRPVSAAAAARLAAVVAELTGRPALVRGASLGWPAPPDGVRAAAVPGDAVRPALPAVLLAAVVHGELLTAEPFGTGSGVVARAAGRLTLHSRGLDLRAVSVPEVGHLALGDYVHRAADYGCGEPAAVAAWLRHCCAAVTLGAREGLAMCEARLRG